MRVLFLDFDGVLNSLRYMQASYEERTRAAEAATGYEQHWTHYVLQIDPEAVKLVDEVVEHADAHVVVSSTWRKYHELWQLVKMLHNRGSKLDASRFIGRTCDNFELSNGDWSRRGHEIQAWLDQHPEVTSFAIVDDDSDMEHLCDRLVQTSWERGIERKHVEKLVEMLGGK